ncbi:hypothetical protein M0R45_009936 [Rubus argutus]|uniref:Uncharacterized protein n=1 Tax=Rubus argutus TaxID=59490 RepID=A0AAW1Y5V7_RUBAR
MALNLRQRQTAGDREIEEEIIEKIVGGLFCVWPPFCVPIFRLSTWRTGRLKGEKGWMKSYELDSSDPFWAANGSLAFPEVAGEE